MPRPLRTGIALLFCSTLIAAFITGCGDDSTPTKPAQPMSVGGNANKAPMVGTTVNLHTINANGSIGAFVAGPFTTDANGDWTGSIPIGSTGPYVMVAIGGSYTDEATGTVVTLAAGQELYGIYGTGTCAVTPLTHATFLAMQAMVTGGTSLATAITRATSSSDAAFGFSFTTTIPSDAATASADQKEYAALLGGISRLLNVTVNAALVAFTNTHPLDLVIGLAKDMADGKLDGLDALGAAILVPTNATGTATAALPALSSADLSDWLTEANLYAASHTNLSGITFITSTAWNPSNPAAGGGGGGGGGTITFSGSSGLDLLDGNTSCTPNSSHVVSGNQLVWDDLGRQIQILVIPATQSVYPGKADNVYVVYSGRNPSVVWNKYAPAGVPGVTILPGGTTSADSTKFTNAVVDEITSGGTSLTLNGTLANPSAP